jgi:hypothetical protein
LCRVLLEPVSIVHDFSAWLVFGDDASRFQDSLTCVALLVVSSLAPTLSTEYRAALGRQKRNAIRLAAIGALDRMLPLDFRVRHLI